MMKKIISSLSIIAMVFSTIAYKPLEATAAQMTGVKDTASTITAGATATHVITATLVGANTIATGDTIVYAFAAANFTLNAIGNWQVTDFTFNDGTNRGNPDAVGATPSCTGFNGTDDYIVTVDVSNVDFTVTPCGTYTASGAAATTTFTINGTTTTGTGTMTNGADVDSSQLTITETTDSATAAIVTETNATVTITASVSPTLTFSNDDPTIGFGTLSSSTGRYANGAGTGSAAPTRVTAHTMLIGTNAPTGYTLTYNGATLTHSNAVDTIPGADINGDADGTQGSSQFALAGTETGGGAMVAGYDAATPNWDFIPSTVTSIATATAATSSSSIAMEYLANISAGQAAGNYSTTLDYVVSGNF